MGLHLPPVVGLWLTFALIFFLFRRESRKRAMSVCPVDSAHLAADHRDAFRDKDVLEIGCGIVTDGLEFARNGANYVGVDLTLARSSLLKSASACLGCRAASRQQTPRKSY